ncbi:MAG: transporter substrate-binding domain-containing protein [Burkholderiaceae bacterium]|nr:transporter substrate-binding domain-containing protein [Burkholderiaceae bacterium]
MPRITRRSLIAALLAALTLPLTAPASAELADLDKIRASGKVSVAVYDDFPPYSGKQGGIDHDLAEALAKKLGLKLSLIPFPAGEDIGDDLRNMVWKGHYLGIGPADVMLHVPVDRNVMQKNDKVEILAPYYRDTVQLVRNVKAIGEVNGIDSLAGKKLGAEKVSISAMVLLGEASLRDNVTIYPSGVEALQKLKAGELDAVVATRAEIESVIRGDAKFEVTDAPFQRLPRKGWVIGMAVRKDNVELARALQQAVNELFDSGEMAALFNRHGVRSVKP